MREIEDIQGPDVGSFMDHNKEVAEPKGGSVLWTEDLETGIDILDEQHHHYINLLNDFLAKASQHSNTDQQANQLKESFDFLRQYAAEHFSTEEVIMKNEAYPDYASHVEEHAYFLSHVDELYKELCTQGFSEKLSREVNYYTMEWFIDHILDSDMTLVTFLRVRNGKH